MVELGTTHEMTWTVSEEHLASTFGSGLVEVLATPVLVGFCEEACRILIERELPPGQKTVGVSVSLEHTAATPPGMTVTVRATLVEIAGRKRVFHVECQDNAEPVAHGSHTRFVIDSARFEARIAAKASQIDRD